MHAVSPSNVFTHPRTAPSFDPLSLSLSSPPTPGSTAPPTAQNPNQELEQLRQRARELEILNQFATSRVEELEKERNLRQRHDGTGPNSATPEFSAEWDARTEARKRQYCSPNRAGNAREYLDLAGSTTLAPPPHDIAPYQLHLCPFTENF